MQVPGTFCQRLLFFAQFQLGDAGGSASKTQMKTQRTAQLQSVLAARGLRTTARNRLNLVQRLADDVSRDPDEDPLSSRWDWLRNLAMREGRTHRQHIRQGRSFDTGRVPVSSTAGAAAGQRGYRLTSRGASQLQASRERQSAPRFMLQTASISQKYGLATKRPRHAMYHNMCPQRADHSGELGTSSTNTLVSSALQTVGVADTAQAWGHAAPRRAAPRPALPQPAPDWRRAGNGGREHAVSFSAGWQRRGQAEPVQSGWDRSFGRPPETSWNYHGVRGKCKYDHGVGDYNEHDPAGRHAGAGDGGYTLVVPVLVMCEKQPNKRVREKHGQRVREKHGQRERRERRVDRARDERQGGRRQERPRRRERVRAAPSPCDAYEVSHQQASPAEDGRHSHFRLKRDKRK